MLTNMQLLERYLHAIEFWLPKEQRRDILAEISEDLHSQIEDQQDGLGRVLTEAEFGALLKQRGRPMLVANRYRPQQSLIGPLWFPSYLGVLKMAGALYVPSWIAVYIAVHRLQHPGEPWIETVAAAWSIGWTVAFMAAGAITLIFALVQLADTRTHFMDKWNPRELPPVKDPYKISRANSIAEVVVGVVFVMWWVTETSSLVILNGPTVKLVLTHVWFYYFWGCLAMALLNIGLSIANLRRPYWTEARAAVRLLMDFAAGVLFCWLLKANVIAELVIADASAARTMEIKNLILMVMDRCLPVAVIVVAVVASVDLWRIVRVSRRERAAVTRGLVA